MNQQKGFSAIFIVIVVVVLVVAAYFIFMRDESAIEKDIVPEPPISDSDDTMEPLLIGNNAIYVSDAKPSTSVKVGFAILANSGYVVIHEDSASKPGAIVGSSDILLQGESKDFEVMLSREGIDGETLYAMLHSDNGDDTFDPAEDSPIKDDRGNIILMKFQISSSADESDAISL